MADVAHEENVIEKDERTFIHSIIDFGDTVAREVMTPRPDMVTVEADVTVRDALEAALAAGYSRIPVEEEGIDDIIGIAYTKDLVRAERVGKAGQAVRVSMRPAKFVPESKDVSDLLREMQEEKFHMAIVVDEYGGTAGLITLEDLLEELVGDIVDEFDVEEPTVERLDDGSVMVQRGLLGRRRRRAARGGAARTGRGTPSAGSCSTWSGRVPDAGDSVEVDGFRLPRSTCGAGASGGCGSSRPATPDRGRRRHGDANGGDGEDAGVPATRHDRQLTPMRSGFVAVVGRPNVGQVDARQPDGRHQGRDHLVAAQHDAPPHPRRPARRGGRRPGRLRRHAGDPPPAQRARDPAERDGHRRAARRRRDHGGGRRHRGHRPRRPHRARALGRVISAEPLPRRRRR